VVWVLKGAGFESRARGLSGHYMTFAGQLLLEIPVALGIVLTARAKRWRYGAALVAVLGFAALAATFTRSAWLGLFVSSVLLMGALWPPGLVLLALGGLAAWNFAPGAWGERLHSVADPKNLWNRERVFMWEAGVQMVRDHPLTGVGLQDLHTLYDQYRSPDSVERAGHLHNAYVQIAASMGALGLAAFAWLYGSLLRTAWSTLGSWQGLAKRARSTGLAAGVPLGVVAALVGFLVAGCFEWNFGDEELLYHLYTLVGLAWSAGQWWEADV
jgi:O-antigen ligase